MKVSDLGGIPGKTVKASIPVITAVKMRVHVNGVEINVEIEGSGPALILLHGNGEDHSIFDRAVFHLSKHFTVYLPDSRGHGRSSSVDEYHYDDMVEDMYRLIRELRIDTPVFCGYSDGGIIGLLLASRHPGLLSRLIVCGANTDPSMLKGLFMFRCRHSKRLSSDPKIRMMLEEPHITAEDLSRIDVPTMVVAGSRDAVKLEDTEFIASSIGKSEMVILKGETHGSYIEDGGKLARIVMDACGIE